MDTPRELRIDSPDVERRRRRRVALIVPLPARAGRVLGTVMNLGEGGARLSHKTAVTRGSSRFSFRWCGEDFATDTEIVESRLVNSPDGVSYESRLIFRELEPASRALLRRVLKAVTDRQMLDWLKNLHGELPSAPQVAHPAGNTTFIRCLLDKGRWRKEVARDDKQPRDGFLVANTVSQGEISQMCAGYERLDEDGRELLRLFARAI